jgi:GST-like protein
MPTTSTATHPTLDLYFFPTPNGQKITLMLEECELPYTVHLVHLGKGDQFQAEYLKINPNNKIPSLIDRAAPGGPLTLFESGAILWYLAEKTGRFCPPGLHGRYEVLKWVMWQMSGLGPVAGQASFFRSQPALSPPAVEHFTKEGARLYGVMERTLAAGPKYLAGEYSIADMASWPWVRQHERQGQDLAHFPHVQAWFERIAARPAVQRAIAVGVEPRR